MDAQDWMVELENDCACWPAYSETSSKQPTPEGDWSDHRQMPKGLGRQQNVDQCDCVAWVMKRIPQLRWSRPGTDQTEEGLKRYTFQWPASIKQILLSKIQRITMTYNSRRPGPEREAVDWDVLGIRKNITDSMLFTYPVSFDLVGSSSSSTLLRTESISTRDMCTEIEFVRIIFMRGSCGNGLGTYVIHLQ